MLTGYLCCNFSGKMADESSSLIQPSLRLCQVMDQIGVSEEIRKVWKETYIRNEIMSSYNGATKESYIFGSSIEGSKTLSMVSDVDELIALSSIPVIQNEADATRGKSFLLVQGDVDHKPGYGKLQLLEDGVAIRWDRTTATSRLGPFPLVKDEQNNVYLSNMLFSEQDVENGAQKPDAERHGPALLGDALGVESEDIVLATRCKSWPTEANEWLVRHREYNWPTKQLIEQMKSYGFFLVPIGHPHSKQRNLGWRLSLSLQERLLMWSLDPIQFKCYVLLKLIKKDIINRKVGVESISSYHCKTCVFYMVERTSPDFWKPDNFLSALEGCLQMMLNWADEGFCPNYFIPEENMFERRVHGIVRDKLCKTLRELLSSNNKFLLGIETDGFGQKLKNFNATRSADTLFAKIRLYVSSGFSIKDRAHVKMLSLPSNDVDKLINSLGNAISEIKDTKTITEHTEEETKEALSYFLPYFELSLMSAQAAREAKLDNGESKLQDILSSNKWLELSKEADCLSVQLKQATFLFTTGQEKMSLDILRSVEICCQYFYVTACKCRVLPFSGVNFSTVLPPIVKLQNEHMSAKQFLNSFFVPCVSFLPVEKDLIPSALIFEMYRSQGMPAGSRYDFLDDWYDWAVIDGKVLLHFLFFLNYTKLAMNSKADDTLKCLESLLINDRNLKHKETGFNLLGWALKERGNTERAMWCFLESLKTVKSHNVALWHLMIMLNEMVNR